jgi:hypothetical protein
MSTQQHCQLCETAMAHVFTARVLSRYDVEYFRCPRCEFLRTEKPYWLDEAYSRAIAATDTGIVVRNLNISRQLTFVLPQLFQSDARYLDVAGGTGLMTRLMRDNGFDFYSEDRYCDNVMAFGFDGEVGAGRYAAVTAFEALEHMEQPLEFIQSSLERSSSGTFIFSTELFKSPIPKQEWWYFSLATGQHIAFFSARTLQCLADRLRVNFLTHRGLHVFSRLPISARRYRRALDQAGSRLFARTRKRNASLTDRDHHAMTERAVASGKCVDKDSSASAGTFSFDASGDIRKAAEQRAPRHWWQRFPR